MTRVHVFLSLFIVATSVVAQSPEALNAYRAGELQQAASLFGDAVKANPSDVEALIGAFFLNDEVDGLPSDLDLAEQLAELAEPPLLYYTAYQESLFPLLVEKSLRKRYSKLYDRLIADTRLPLSLREELFSRQASFDYIAGDPAGGMKQLAEFVQLRDWSLVGPFPNRLGSGFNNDYGPLERPNTDEVFEGKFKAQLGWYTAKNVTPGMEVNMGHYMAVSSSVSFAQTFVTLPQAGTYTLALGVTGSAKVWIDDALVYAEEEERTARLDDNLISVDLPAGNHRILLQLGAAERSKSSFFARLLDASGKPVVVSSTATPTSYTPAERLEADVAHGRVYAESKALVDGGTAKPFEQYAFLSVLIRTGRYEAAREYLNTLLPEDELTPIVVDLQNVLFNLEDNETGAEELKSKVRNLRPNDPEMIVERFEDAVELEDYTLAEKELEALEELSGETEQVMLLKMSLAFLREDLEDGIGHLNRAKLKYPSSTNLLWLDYRVQTQMYNAPIAGRRKVELFLKTYNLETVRIELAQLYQEDGDKRGVELYKEILKYLPHRPNHQESIAQAHIANKRYKSALLTLDELMEQAPYVADYFEKRGNVLKLLKREDDAFAAYTRSLELNPNNYDLRASMRELRGERSLYSFFDSTSVEEVIEEFGDEFNDSGFSIAILADDVRRIVYEDGVSEKRVMYVYQILNEKGIDVLKEYSISGVRLYDAQIIKPNGSRIDGERNGSTVVFPKLAVGDYVYINFRERDYHYGKLFGHFWEDYNLNAWCPVGRTRYQVLTPQGFSFAHQVTGAELKPSVRTSDEFELHTWVAEQPPFIKSEDYMPAHADAGQVLHLSSIPDWQYIVDWYGDLSESRTQADYAVEKAVAKLFPDGYDDVGEEERIRRIYEFIVSDIAYSSLPFRQSAYVPQRAGKTLATQLGDCKDVSSLFVAMGREVGVEADLVLVDTRNNGERNLVLPTMMFNHCIVRLRNSGEYLELTDKYLPYSTVGNSLTGSTALPIVEGADEATLARILAGDKGNGLTATSEVELSENDLLLQRRTSYYGGPASNMRHSFYNESQTDQEASLRRSIDYSIEKPFKLESFAFDGLETLGDTVVSTCDIRVEGAVSKLQSLRFFQLPWTSRNSSLDFLSDSDRNHELCLWKMSQFETERERIRVKMPEGTDLVEVPKDVSYAYNGLTYSLRFERTGSNLIAERVFEMNRDSFQPDEFDAVATLFKQVAEADDQLIGIQ